VVLQNVLMFLHDGREVRQEILEEAWDRGGEGGTSSVRCLYPSKPTFARLRQRVY